MFFLADTYYWPQGGQITGGSTLKTCYRDIFFDWSGGGGEGQGHNRGRFISVDEKTTSYQWLHQSLGGFLRLSLNFFSDKSS